MTFYTPNSLRFVTLSKATLESVTKRVTYVHQVREVSRDLRIVHPKKGDRTGRLVARIL